jgi:hypothetical protein
MLRAASEPSPTLIELKPTWQAIHAKLQAERESLEAKIHYDDPIRSPVDLLGPMDRALDEPTHTRILAYLFDPFQTHGFDTALLIALLERIRPPSNGRSLLNLLHDPDRQIKVTPEYRYLVDQASDRSVARCDIWLEIDSKRGRGLVVIENKINAPEGRNQLQWYERRASKWRRETKGRRPLLVYLTPEGRDGAKQWLPLTYLDVASSFREVWKRRKRAPGLAFLASYIATIMRHIQGVNVDSLENNSIDVLQSYLGKSSLR